ncbi:hypothetical protein VTI74DRAFT_3709 [Chaetomium olivicolor]
MVKQAAFAFLLTWFLVEEEYSLPTLPPIRPSHSIPECLDHQTVRCDCYLEHERGWTTEKLIREFVVFVRSPPINSLE